VRLACHVRRRGQQFNDLGLPCRVACMATLEPDGAVRDEFSETMSSTMSAGIAKAADLVKVTRPAGDDRGCRHDSGCQGDDLVAQALRALDRRASTPMGSSASAREVCPSYGSGRVPVPSGGSLMPIPLRYGVCARIRRPR